MQQLLALLLLITISVSSREISEEQFPQNYSSIADLIISTGQNGDYSTLSYICDTFGPRYRGTPNLEMALDYIVETMKGQYYDSIVKEPVVNITNWVRGNEYLQLLSPRNANMAILGLGNSVGTGVDGIEAEVFVVSSFEELEANATYAAGKIILFNVPFTNYSVTVAYRSQGANAAARVGGLAALVRSITPFSLYTPHTGEMGYADGVVKVPTAAVTIEDAEMMARFQERGQPVWVKLYMEAHTAVDTSSFNIIAEIEGREFPNEVIVLGGHTDSWDVGTGCMDDGGGMYSAWHSVALLGSLIEQGLIPRPRRTIRNVLWVDEEISQRGAATYAIDHLNELKDHVIAMESDSGNFDPVGFGFSGSEDAYEILLSISETLLSGIGAGNISYGPTNGVDTDTGPLFERGVPVASLQSEYFITYGEKEAKYFYYHHSNADTFTNINMNGIRNSVASFAVFSYVIADMEQRLPNGSYVPPPQ